MMSQAVIMAGQNPDAHDASDDFLNGISRDVFNEDIEVHESERSFAFFSKYQLALFQGMDTEKYHESPEKINLAGWIRFSVKVNPTAAFQFQILAEEFQDLTLAPDKVILTNPLTFLDGPAPYKTVASWVEEVDAMDNARLCGVLRRNKPQWRSTVYHFRRGFRTIKHHRGLLNAAMQRVKDTEPTPLFIDPSRAWRSVTQLYNRLEQVEYQMTEFLFRADDEEDGDDEYYSKSQSSPARNDAAIASGLRKRNLAAHTQDGASDTDVSSESEHSSQKAPDVIPKSNIQDRAWQTLKQWLHISFSFSPPSLPSHLPDTHAIPSAALHNQSALVGLALAVSAIASLFIGLSIMQPRPAACIPSRSSRDDGFWALLSQLFIQLLSLYSTLVPLARNKQLPLRSIWFIAALCASALAAILAPAVYGVSWQAATLLGFVSAFAALMANVELAGAVQRLSVDSEVRRETNGTPEV